MQNKPEEVYMVSLSGVMSKTTAIFICILTVCYSHAQTPGPVVELKSGSVRGLSYPIAFGYVINRFVGIPYAAPPVGNLRFSAPQPAIPWEGVRNAGMKFAAHCPQNPVRFPWNVTVGKWLRCMNKSIE